MEVVLTLICGASLFLSGVYLFYYFQTKSSKAKAEVLLVLLEGFDWKQIPIKLSSSTLHAYRTYGGLYTPALLYYNEDLLLITMHKQSVFGSARAPHLPLVIPLQKDFELPKGIQADLVSKVILHSDAYLLKLKKYEACPVEVTLYTEKDNETLKAVMVRLEQATRPGKL